MKRSFAVMKSEPTFGKTKAKTTRGTQTKRSRTTLAKHPDGPFPRSKFTKLVYENALTALGTGTSGFLPLGTKPNSAFDYDNSSGAAFGNKQPLYYDSLLSASGPYKNYKVSSWETTYTIVNTSDSPMTVWAMPPVSATSEVDSAAEADNFPGVVRLYLTGKSGSKSHGTITVTGDVKDVYASASTDLGFVGSYNTDPAYLVYAGILVQTADGSAISAYVAVRHVMNTTLQVVDALVS